MIIGMSIFWLSLYAFILLDIDPFHNIQRTFGDDDDLVLTIKGNVNRELQITVSDIKSEKYQQIKDRKFHFINAIGREFDGVYSGASLWSILIEENLLSEDAISFLFIGADGYYAETSLNLTLAENNTEQIILAYEKDGEPLYSEGPIKSIVDYEVIPDEITTHYAVKYLKTIMIQ